MSTGTMLDLLPAWRRAICDRDKGPTSSTTRHLLLALAVRLEHGDRSPSESDLAEDTGLVKRSIITHLQLAIEDGWIVRRSIRGKGRIWRRHGYEHRFPARFDGKVQPDEVNEMHRVVAVA